MLCSTDWPHCMLGPVISAQQVPSGAGLGGSPFPLTLVLLCPVLPVVPAAPPAGAAGQGCRRCQGQRGHCALPPRNPWLSASGAARKLAHLDVQMAGGGESPSRLLCG